MSCKSSLAMPFQAHSVETVPLIHQRVRVEYCTGKTKDIQFRLTQLRKLYWAMEDFTEEMVRALKMDLNRSRHEAFMSDIDWCKTECANQIDNIERWAKDQPIPNVPVLFWAMKHCSRPEPLGNILVIGAFNFPFQLSLVPLIGAIGAGNTIVLKPSEHSPASAMVMEKIIKRLDPGCYAVINGGLPVSKALLDLKWNKIVFTGGKSTGTIIAKKAAETLTPTLLELGGQNPAFVTKNADVKLAAKRLLWGKIMNAGQVCVSHNYVLVEQSMVSMFIAALHSAYRTFMPNGAKACADYCRISNIASFNRLRKMLDATTGKVVMGGDIDEATLFIEPTVVLTDNRDDSLLIHETFGPIWSIVPFDTLDDAITLANNLDPTPLSLFTFGSDEENEKILRSVTSGGATINDSCTHASLPCAPFGGVGESGMGNYHGEFSFKTFSHYRTVAKVPSWTDKLLRVRYMPYSNKELRRFRAMQAKKINFDRNGNVQMDLICWLSLAFALGGRSAKHIAFRWGFLLVVVIMTFRLRSYV